MRAAVGARLSSRDGLLRPNSHCFQSEPVDAPSGWKQLSMHVKNSQLRPDSDKLGPTFEGSDARSPDKKSKRKNKSKKLGGQGTL